MWINVKRETVCMCCFDDELWILADHIEVDHEREMPGYWSFEELEKAHNAMHRMRDDWDHRH